MKELQKHPQKGEEITNNTGKIEDETIPPIVLEGKNFNLQQVEERINETAKENHIIEFMNKNMLIQTNSMNDYLAVKETLRQRETGIFIKNPDQAIRKAFVLKGLDNNPTREHVKNILQTTYKMNIIQVYNMKKTTRPSYLVISENDVTLELLKEKVTDIDNIAVTWGCPKYKEKLEYLNKEEQENEIQTQTFWQSSPGNNYTTATYHTGGQGRDATQPHYQHQKPQEMENLEMVINYLNQTRQTNVTVERRLDTIEKQTIKIEDKLTDIERMLKQIILTITQYVVHPPGRGGGQGRG
ncbi:hypothetical protein JTB14_028134 [Gonioctena quinquepunctata]|nr:hypothetical protein JTB14_028134 [Gonioctena quinquepunctata]